MIECDGARSSSPLEESCQKKSFLSPKTKDPRSFKTALIEMNHSELNQRKSRAVRHLPQLKYVFMTRSWTGRADIGAIVVTARGSGDVVRWDVFHCKSWTVAPGCPSSWLERVPQAASGAETDIMRTPDDVTGIHIHHPVGTISVRVEFLVLSALIRSSLGKEGLVAQHVVRDRSRWTDNRLPGPNYIFA